MPTMYDQHAHDLREAQAAAAIEIKGRLEDADDGELAAALALVLEKAGVDVPHDAWTCWRDLSELSDEVRITLKTDSLRSLFAAAQFASDGTLKMSMLTDGVSMRLEGRVLLFGTVVLLRAVWHARGMTLLKDELLLKGLPVLALRHAPKTAQSGSAVLDVETNRVWDNVMVGLSFEDAAACLGFACRSVKDRPQRERGRFEDVYTVYGTQPGCAAHLFASGGTPDEAARMLCETSVKAVDILMRRLDMARASVFEGEGKTAFLQGACAR